MTGILTQSMVSLHADADIKSEMQSKLKSKDPAVRHISYWYLTSGMSCFEINKYYELVGGWD